MSSAALLRLALHASQKTLHGGFRSTHYGIGLFATPPSHGGLPFSSGGPNRNELDDDGDRHSDEAQEHAGKPLEAGERRRVGKLAEELDHDELEDDRAAEDTHEDIVLQHALEHIELLHLPRTYLIEHLR